MDDPFDNLGRHSVILAPGLRAVGESIHTGLCEATANPRYLLWRQGNALGDLGARDTVPAQQDDSGAPNVPRWSTRATYNVFQLLPLGTCQPQWRRLPHDALEHNPSLILDLIYVSVH